MCKQVKAASGGPARPGRNRSITRLGPLARPASQRLHLERGAEQGTRSEAARTGATPVLPPVRERKEEREKLPFWTTDARL